MLFRLYYAIISAQNIKKGSHRMSKEVTNRTTNQKFEQVQTKKRRTFGIVGSFLFATLFIVLILNQLNILPTNWSKVIAATLVVLGSLSNIPFIQDALKSISSRILDTIQKKDAINTPVLNIDKNQQVTLSNPKRTCTIIKLPSLNLPSILPRENDVKDIYQQLLTPDTNAIILTGLTGTGKSTLAKLVYHYVEKQRQYRAAPF